MAKYSSGRGFQPSSNFFVDEHGNIQRGNVHGAYGFSRFWEGRDEFGTGGPSGDWRKIKRPTIQGGRNKLGRPFDPLPLGLGKKKKAGAVVSDEVAERRQSRTSIPAARPASNASNFQIDEQGTVQRATAEAPPSFDTNDTISVSSEGGTWGGAKPPGTQFSDQGELPF